MDQYPTGKCQSRVNFPDHAMDYCATFGSLNDVSMHRAHTLSSATLHKLSTHVPLSPNSIIWYQPMGGAALRLGM